MRLRSEIWNGTKTRTGQSATGHGWTSVHFSEEMHSTRIVQHGWNGGCSWNSLPNRWPLMTLFGTRRACRNWHNIVLRSRHTVTSKLENETESSKNRYSGKNVLAKQGQELQRASLYAWSLTEGGQSRAAVKFFAKVIVGPRTRTDQGHPRGN